LWEKASIPQLATSECLKIILRKLFTNMPISFILDISWFHLHHWLNRCTAQTSPILVSRNLDYWYVVEVEMAHHSLSGHVLPQIRTFAHANYATRQVIEALQSGLPKVDQRDLIRLVRDVHPEVLVIVYGPASGWREPLLGVPALLHEIRLFRPRQGPSALYMDGPTLRQSSLLAFNCVHRSEMASLLFLDGVIPDTIPKRIEIEVEEAVIQAEVLDQDHLTVLRSPAFRDLALGQYQLIQSESGSFNLGKI